VPPPPPLEVGGGVLSHDEAKEKNIYIVRFCVKFLFCGKIGYFSIMKNPFFLIIGGFIGIYFYKKYQLIKNLQITLAGVKFNFDISNPILTISIRLNNQSSGIANISNTELKLINNNAVIGNVLYVKNQTVLANQTTIIDIPIRINIKDTIINLINDIYAKKFVLNIVGYSTIDGIKLPINYNYTWE
jgi:hypothetical protein